jgi:hypothetical protein
MHVTPRLNRWRLCWTGRRSTPASDSPKMGHLSGSGSPLVQFARDTPHGEPSLEVRTLGEAYHSPTPEGNVTCVFEAPPGPYGGSCAKQFKRFDRPSTHPLGQVTVLDLMSAETAPTQTLLLP